MTTLIDTNILLDVVTDDPSWTDWSIQQLESASIRGSPDIPLLTRDVKRYRQYFPTLALINP